MLRQHGHEEVVISASYNGVLTSVCVWGGDNQIGKDHVACKHPFIQFLDLLPPALRVEVSQLEQIPAVMN